jgi:outer membrane protein
MLKRFKILTIAAGFVFAAAMGAGAADVAKMGLVDYQRVLDNSSAGQAAEANMAKKHDEMKAELKRMEKEVVDLKEKLEREAAVMSKDARDEKEREFRMKVNDLQFMEKKYVKDLQDQERETIGKIQKEINEVVKEMGKQGGYTLILEKRECGAIYYPDSMDLTDKVIETYNKKSPGK